MTRKRGRFPPGAICIHRPEGGRKTCAVPVVRRNTGMDEQVRKRRKWLTIALLTIPVWLVGSGGFGVWLYFRHQAEKEREEVARFSQNVSSVALEKDLRTVVLSIGERNPASNSGKGLTQTAAWIEGSLGPSNAGYPVKHLAGPVEAKNSWPLLWVTVRGTKPEAPAIWVMAAYDSPVGSRGVEAGATAVVAGMAAAQALAADKPQRSVHFLFVPHGNSRSELAGQTWAKVRQIVQTEGSPLAVVCLDAMGAGETLWVSSRDTESVVLPTVGTLGKIVGAEVICLNDGHDLSSELFALGLPAVRVATRAPLAEGESDETLPQADVFAASTGRLVEWIRRISALP